MTRRISKATSLQDDFTAILETITDAQEALELLQQIYRDIGPYQDGKLQDQTWSRVRDFFGFDDSE